MTIVRQVLHEHNPAQLNVETITNSPPQHSVGRRVIVGPSPTGVFSGYANRIAWSNGVSWQFDQPLQGWRVYVDAAQEEYVFHKGRWQPSIVIAEKGDLIVGGNNGVPEKFPVPSIEYGIHHFLSAYQEEAASPKTLYYGKLLPGHIRLVNGFRLIGSSNNNKYGEEIPLGQGLAFDKGMLVCTVVPGGGSESYHYFATPANQPSQTAPGLQLTHAAFRSIAIEKHGILNDKAAFIVSVKLLLHGDHRFLSNNVRYGFSIFRNYEFSVYVEDVPGSGDLPYFGSIKTISHSGKYIRYSGISGNVDAQGDLRETDVTADLTVVNTYLRFNVRNNLLNNPGLPSFDFPLYGKYTVNIAEFSTSQTTSSGDATEGA